LRAILDGVIKELKGVLREDAFFCMDAGVSAGEV
jgi:hypothetical protein